MSTVAVSGASGPVGRALLARLDADPAVDRIIGIDVDEPPMPVATLELRRTDLRDRLLPLALEGADTLVHLALATDATRDSDELFARDIHGTRNLLAAASKVAVRTLVHLSGAGAYGAHPDNPLPLMEDAPLRANPDEPAGYHRMLAEELVDEWARDHPAARVAVLRPAAVLGPGVEGALAQHLLGPRLLLVKGNEPPRQFVHVEDVAAAVQLAVTGDLSGRYNVAADGWLSVAEICAVLGTKTFEVPEAPAFALVRRLWQRGLWYWPPGALRHVMFPVVVSSERLHAAGWSPTRSNREILREFTAEHEGMVAFGPARVRRRDAAFAALGLAGATIGLLAGGRAARRNRERGDDE